LVAAPFLAWNLKLYGSPLAPYYMPGRIGVSGGLPGALAGNLVSPSRGLLVFSPVLLFSAVGVALEASTKRLNRLDRSLLVILGLHWVAISAFPKWWGGWSYGPRFASDVLPYLVYFLIPVLAWLGQPRTPAVVAVFFWVAVAASGFIHYRGASDRATFDWNAWPANVDADPSRVWDWRDPQFLRGAAWADWLLPPRVVVSPASVNLLPGAPGDDRRQVVLRVRLARGTPFDWQGEASPGITLAPDHGKSTREAVIVAAIGANLLQSSDGSLPGIRIAARLSGSSAPWQTAVVSVNLVQGTVHRVYLPVAAGVAVEASP
jgi:hypothetical protein